MNMRKFLVREVNRPPGGGLRSEDGVAYGTDVVYVIYVIYVTDIDVTDITDMTDVTDITDVTDMGMGGVDRCN